MAKYSERCAFYPLYSAWRGSAWMENKWSGKVSEDPAATGLKHERRFPAERTAH